MPYALPVTRITRLSAAVLATSVLTVGLATPAMADTPSPSPSAPLSPNNGELLTTPDDGCGTLTVSRTNPLFNDSITVTIEGAPTADDVVPVFAVPGLLVSDRWFPINISSSPDDASDGAISVIDQSFAVLDVAVDENGDGARTFTYPLFDEVNSSIISSDEFTTLVYLGGIFPAAWVALCDDDESVQSRVDVRPGRERLDVSLDFDQDVAGSLTATGVPDDIAQLIPLFAPLQSGLSPADSLWLALFGNGSGSLGSAPLVFDGPPVDGTLTMTHTFDELEPGTYALGFLAFRGTLSAPVTAPMLQSAAEGDGDALAEALVGPAAAESPFEGISIPKAEWVVTVANDGVLTIARADGSDESVFGESAEPELADTGAVEPILPFAAGLIVVMFGVAMLTATRRRTARA